jgi:methyltransferase (TIGR00027 family)
MPRNKPSLTARKVASDFLFFVEDPQIARFAPEGSIRATYQVLEAAGRLKPWMVSLIKAPWYQRFGRALAERMAPGQMLYMVLRKRFFDDEVRDAIEAGASQVLVVGGGYDTLCLRLAAEYTGVTFVELDHPPTHREKFRAVEAMGMSRSNLHLEPVDLGERALQDVLSELPIWDAASKAVVVAEGVLPYLDVAEVEAFLAAVRSSTGAGSRLLISYLHETELNRVFRGILGKALTWSLHLVGEPFRWGVSSEGIEPFLIANGYRRLGDAARFDLEQRYLQVVPEADLTVARLERVVVAEPLTKI